MNPYSGQISQMTDEEVAVANKKLKETYGVNARQMINLTDGEAAKLRGMNRSQRRKWMKENGKFK